MKLWGLQHGRLKEIIFKDYSHTWFPTISDNLYSSTPAIALCCRYSLHVLGRFRFLVLMTIYGGEDMAGAWHQSLIAVENECNLLKRVSSGLRVGKIDNDAENHQKYNKYDVVLPGDRFECDPVDEYVEEQSQVCRDLSDDQTTSAQRVFPDLYWVCKKEPGIVSVLCEAYVSVGSLRRKCNVVESIVEKQERNDSDSGRRRPCMCEAPRERSDHNE